MTWDEAKKIIEKQSKIIEFIFRQAKGLDPLFHYSGERGQSVITTRFIEEDGDAGKDAVANVVRRVLAREKAEWVLYISEAWLVKLEPGEDMTVRPSEHEKRVEVVIYQLEYLADGVSYCCAEQKILRGGRGGPCLGLLQFAPQGIRGGRFSDLLPGVHRTRH